MKLTNPFSIETRDLFWDARYTCWICGGNGNENGGMELHHITGRDNNSPFNAAPLCKLCHGKMGHTKDEERWLFEKTLQYLQGRVEITQADEHFMLTHPHLIIGLRF